MADYLLYVDDSGTKEYAARGQEYDRAGGRTRYFVFGGVLISAERTGAFADQIATTKRLFFGTDKVEIKSNWLRIPKERGRRYLKPYGISEVALSNFVRSYAVGRH